MTGSEPVKKVRLNRGGEAEERRLVEAAQRDAACFADLYDNYFALVYSYIARRAPDRGATEDLTAEVFHKALASLPRFKWTGAPFAAWLFRIASNMIADRAKRAAREGGVAQSEADTAPLPQTVLEEIERKAKVSRLVDDLADDQRRVIIMRFAEEKSIRDIANELGRSDGAIKQLQFRALQSLRAKLAGDQR